MTGEGAYASRESEADPALGRALRSRRLLSATCTGAGSVFGHKCAVELATDDIPH